jgi:hypothetical protein
MTDGEGLACYSYIKMEKWQKRKRKVTRLSQWSGLLLQMLMAPQQVKNISNCNRTWRFITMFTWAHTVQHHEPNESSQQSPIFTSTPRSSKQSLPLRLLAKILYECRLSPMHATCPTHFILLAYIIIWQAGNYEANNYSSFQPPITASLLGTDTLLNLSFSKFDDVFASYIIFSDWHLMCKII